MLPALLGDAVVRTISLAVAERFGRYAHRRGSGMGSDLGFWDGNRPVELPHAERCAACQFRSLTVLLTKRPAASLGAGLAPDRP